MCIAYPGGACMLGATAYMVAVAVPIAVLM